ncbi:G protein-coupled glucose receptor regulating Gpa2-domain-containing protein [Geopyxis carbonaria]|nr:G protein-coupled glucose receptor regulating Gpa2-domain-containing protein [Geopyxis carbonaria]
MDDPVHGLSMISKEVAHDGNERPLLTGEQLYTLRAIAIAAACISIVSGLVVGYWFVRMKRSFRHHLIMLMIFSDFYKASWQLIYPAVVFAQGSVTSNSRFCQTAGFMMSMGIEASDFATLAIAVHSALYIFRPGMGAVGEGGLFRYRYYVYAAWLTFSILMPSLAFVNKDPAYSAQGTFCYLPVRPFWFRLALAWIPRYLILLTILFLYAAIYIYVRMKFRTFRTSVGAESFDSIDLATVDQPKDSSRLPSLDAHGLIPPSPQPESRQPSHSGDKPFRSNPPFERALLAPHDKVHSSSSSDTANCESRRGSLPTLYPGSTQVSTTVAAAAANKAHKKRQMSEVTASDELCRRRMAIDRQLRLLFIYPLVYALMWVPSLVSHALQFTDRFVYHPSFPLHCVVAFTLPFQCTVDCWLFTIREKPWRYIPDTHSDMWYSRYGFGYGKCKGKSCDKGVEEGGDAWRHRKHMSFEARKAYERRDAERKEAAETWMVGDNVERPSQKRERSWWDLEDNGIEEEPIREENERKHNGEIDELSVIENGSGPVRFEN